MLKSEMERFEALFAELRSEIRELKSSRIAKTVLTMRDAADTLSVSAKTISRMIVTGEIQTVTIGRRQMIPRSEVERVATPHLPPSRTRKLPG